MRRVWIVSPGRASRMRRWLVTRTIGRRAGLLPVWRRSLGSDGLSRRAREYVTAVEDELRELAPLIRADRDSTD